MKIFDLDPNPTIKWRITDICNYKCSYCIRRSFIREVSSLKNDWEKLLSCKDKVDEIATDIYKKFGKKVKIDIIGGEVSLFNDLTYLFPNKEGAVYKVNITTNLSRDLDYYINLNNSFKEKGIELSLTASWHYETADLNTFIDKAKELNKVINLFKCETVLTWENVNWEKFASLCEENNIKYMCEENMLDETMKGYYRQNNKGNNPRYKVISDENKEFILPTRNEFVKIFGGSLPLEGYYCTRDYSYVYIEYDKVVGKDYRDENSPCCGCVNLLDYKLLKEPTKCTRPRCSLCGHVSVSKDKNDLLSGVFSANS